MQERLRVTSAEAKRRVEQWFSDTETDEDAWKALSWRELGKAIGVSYVQVRFHLPKLVMKKYNFTRTDFDNVRYAYAAVRKKKGLQLLPQVIDNIRRLRKMYTIEETAEKLGISPSSVWRHSRTSKKDTSNIRSEKGEKSTD